jgi:hypothetical protein
VCGVVCSCAPLHARTSCILPSCSAYSLLRARCPPDDNRVQSEHFLRSTDCVLLQQTVRRIGVRAEKHFYTVGSNPAFWHSEKASPAMRRRVLTQESKRSARFMLSTVDLPETPVLDLQHAATLQVYGELLNSMSDLSLVEENSSLLCPLLHTISAGFRAQGVRPLAFTLRPLLDHGSLLDLLYRVCCVSTSVCIAQHSTPLRRWGV